MLRHFKQMEMNASCALLGTEDRVYTLAYFMHAFTTKDTHTRTHTHTHAHTSPGNVCVRVCV